MHGVKTSSVLLVSRLKVAVSVKHPQRKTPPVSGLRSRRTSPRVTFNRKPQQTNCAYLQSSLKAVSGCPGKSETLAAWSQGPCCVPLDSQKPHTYDLNSPGDKYCGSRFSVHARPLTSENGMSRRYDVRPENAHAQRDIWLCPSTRRGQARINAHGSTCLNRPAI